MLEEDDEYDSLVVEILDKESAKIDEDLELQQLISNQGFHAHELCGWTVTTTDLNRFRWNSNRTSRTSVRDQRAPTLAARRSFSRQSVKSDVDLEFQHFQNGIAYIEQYRGEKMKRHEAELNEFLTLNTSRKGSDTCDNSSKSQESIVARDKPNANVPVYTRKPRRESASPLIVITSSRAQNSTNNSKRFQGRKLYARPMTYVRNSSQSTKAQNCNTVSEVTMELPFASTSSSSLSTSPHFASPCSIGKESWAVIGTEKRPIPTQKRPIDITRISTPKPRTPVKNTSSYSIPSRRQSAIPMTNSWVRSSVYENGKKFYSDDIAKCMPSRSFSAPNMGNEQFEWPSKGGSQQKVGISEGKSRTSQATQNGTQTCSRAVDYSCYTEMFKNVLEYYGSNKLRTKTNKTQPSSESSTLLSVHT
ncbi:uncharacterized protein LOC116619811 [Nematostella vectensis]|uniref:uncharacterized protein LOC116619811 n=1 Tax=Nematostella vectensis TaxID=45351 RepID=UPI0013905A5B|nr:uncharacterized protein LOC116619811 [Nematostella vectensis]